MPGGTLGRFCRCRGEVFDRSFIRLEVAPVEQFLMDALVNRLEPEGGELGPTAEGVSANGDVCVSASDRAPVGGQDSMRVLRDGFLGLG